VSDLLLIRHGRTPWNECGRIQGHRDIGLSAAGCAEIAARRIPTEYANFRWYASPLTRAVETARLLGARDLKTDARLVELHWGEWQGWTRRGLREHLGDAFADNEARGLAFRPPGGESPSELQLRLREWLAEVCTAEKPVVAVTHKGVIQMAFALATGWDLVSRPPVRLDWQCGQLFSVAGTPPRLRAKRLNVTLATPSAGSGEAGG
jgi:broad specificity phosphatase PhoE